MRRLSSRSKRLPWAFVGVALSRPGFAISWCPTGVNRPILSEIVEPGARATVFATQIAVEGSVSAMLGSPVIALLGKIIKLGECFRNSATASHLLVQRKGIGWREAAMRCFHTSAVTDIMQAKL